MKGQFCKHIWSALLKTQLSHPTFLEEKTKIEKEKISAETTFKAKNPSSFKKPEMSAEQLDRKLKFQEKQSQYRKEQYKIQSQRQKDFKKSKKNSTEKTSSSIPREVEATLDYFKQNGFIFESPYAITEVNLAKKKLSRVFHPDVGGSHEEILQLNKNCEIIVNYIKSIQN